MTVMIFILPVILWKVINIVEEKTVKLFQFQSFCKANVEKQTSVEFSVIVLIEENKVNISIIITIPLTWSMMKIL